MLPTSHTSKFHSDLENNRKENAIGQSSKDQTNSSQTGKHKMASTLTNTTISKRPAHRLPWPSPKKYCKYDKSIRESAEERTTKEQNNSHDIYEFSDSETLDITKNFSSKLEASVLSKEVEVSYIS